jgi:chaperonin GroEL
VAASNYIYISILTLLAAMFLTTEAVVADIPEENAGGGMPDMGGMGGMGGMM